MKICKHFIEYIHTFTLYRIQWFSSGNILRSLVYVLVPDPLKFTFVPIQYLPTNIVLDVVYVCVTAYVAIT